MELSSDKIEKKISKIFNKIFIITILLIIIIAGIMLFIFLKNCEAVDKNNKDTVIFTIESGWTQKKIASELKKNDLIKNDTIFIVYSKINHKTNYQAGVYTLSKDMDIDEILDSITTGKNTFVELQTVTFVEGKRFTYYAKIIEDRFGYKSDDVIKLCKDKEYLQKLINKYWFLTDDILNKDIYYPLEGYLFPDTYEFYKNSSLEDIIEKLLDGMSNHLNKYKTEILASSKSVHSLLTLASMVELEAVTAEDRKIVAGVFTNRLNNHWTLGSDVTTYYGLEKDLTYKLKDEDLAKCNAYNTRGNCNKGLPVGPICSPSYTSIIASIEPASTEYFYFVSDIHRKVYYAVNQTGHDKNVTYLKQNGLWP